ncbi:hypothetical protein N7520_009741 [Penicillium odoratum]|uniref:uncharacterized protein n=1 Tax=Penicillium odoratum TaxID=1167516 RepID=UPI0025497223|nr:uncharacterized protein N7520_009741 [Penicillium odoratum]KAJ5752824.1 hypothetical protein N7520_009741 [Penicillium odoratum]
MKKRAAEDSRGAQKRDRPSNAIPLGSDYLQMATNETRSKRTSNASAISTGLIHDTVHYLQTVTTLITKPNIVSTGVWAALQLATQLLQHTNEEIVAAVAADPNAVIHGIPAQVQQETKCKRCAAEDDEHLYD